MISRLLDWWAAYRRRVDQRILWPVICEQATSEEQARAVFYVHAMLDPAWRRLDMPDMVSAIKDLPYPFLDNPVDN
jgi:hypothetical protein